jgi:hypothetical protein
VRQVLGFWFSVHLLSANDASSIPHSRNILPIERQPWIGRAEGVRVQSYETQQPGRQKFPKSRSKRVIEGVLAVGAQHLLSIGRIGQREREGTKTLIVTR